MRNSAHLLTRQYARIVGSWVEQLGLDGAAYGTHTLRRTKNLRAVQLLLRHSKLESMVRYLEIEVNDASKWRSRRSFSARGPVSGRVADWPNAVLRTSGMPAR
jgi:hypothetical protein